MWSENLPTVEPNKPRFQFLDLFAGVANATKVWCTGQNSYANFADVIDQPFCPFLFDPCRLPGKLLGMLAPLSMRIGGLESG